MKKGRDYFGNEYEDNTLVALNKQVEKMDKLVASGKFKGSFVDRIRPLQMLYNYTIMKLGGLIEHGK